MYDEDANSSNLPANVDPESASDASSSSEEDDLKTYTIIPFDPANPPPEIKRYAHHGKRRRSYTEELIRCQHVTRVLSDSLICGALVWKNKPQDMRSHLLEHFTLDKVQALTDDQVLGSYEEAKRIFLQAIPDDSVYGLDEDDLDEEDEELDNG